MAQQESQGPPPFHRVSNKWVFIAVAAAAFAAIVGIAFLGMAAHRFPDPKLQTAGNFVLFHAVAAVAVCALSTAAQARGTWFLTAAGLLLSGGLLFGGDIATRVMSGNRLFWMAAPLGAGLAISGWALILVGSLAVLRHKDDNKERPPV
ncbi:MAG TPA: DUF423 domain-containing protein [Methylocella sp.]|nr:DUF423 domain-containing protein [Methylocella sp.]